jgi:hypothetical protein
MELADDVNNPHLNATPPLQSQIQSGQRAAQHFVSHPREESLNKFFARFTNTPHTWRARSILASENSSAHRMVAPLSDVACRAK